MESVEDEIFRILATRSKETDDAVDTLSKVAGRLFSEYMHEPERSYLLGKFLQKITKQTRHDV